VAVGFSLGVVLHQVGDLDGEAGELSAGDLDGSVAAAISVESVVFDDVTGELLFRSEK
jgi:hypothetical protein